MIVSVGKYAGFCPGVLYSVEEAMKAIDEYSSLYCLGELIHNRDVLEELEEKGMIFVSDIEEIPDNSRVIFRAHGVMESIYRRAEEKNLEVIDLTCKLVKLIHEKVSREKDNSFIIITGDDKHPENIGTKDFAGVNSIVISENDEIDKVYDLVVKSGLKRVFVVSQTTFKLKKFLELEKIIKDRFNDYEVVIDNTICKTTELRQKEVDELSKDVDLVIVVGGKNSSNTKKLYEIAKNNLDNVIHIENINDLDDFYFKTIEKVLIVAGASTPKRIIDDVKKYLEEYY